MNEHILPPAALGVRDLMPAAGDRAQEEVPMVVRYLRIAKRRRWLILGSIAIALLAGLIVTLLMTRQYTAETTLEIQRENYRIAPVQGVEPETSTVDMEFYQTQYGLLQSRSLAERVATDLRLYDDADFFDMFGEDEIAGNLRGNEPGNNSQAARQDRIRRAGVILLKHVSVSPMRLSRLVTVQFTSPRPQLSADILNAWTRDFISSTLERRYEATSYARHFLEQRLQQLRQRLEEGERLQVAYAARERIINLPTTSSGPDAQGTVNEQPIVAQNLAQLNSALNDATAARVAAESRLRSAGGTTSEALQNQAIATLSARRADLAADYARMLNQFEPQYPPAQALASQIQALDRAIAQEEARVSNTLRENYAVAVARENELKSRVDQLQNDLIDLRGRTIQYNIYQRDVDTSRQLYDGLLQRYKEIGVAAGVGVNNVAVVDPAQRPIKPSSPRILLNMVLALLLGGGIGVALALALDQIDEAIADPSDVERMVGQPLLGAVPKSDADDPMAELEDRKSPLVEAYLSAQTSLAFTTDHGAPKTLAVTSARPAEGKTTSSYALARSLARTGRKVVLVDADMRSPSLHAIFLTDNAAGLSNCLAGSDDLDRMIYRGAPSGVALLPAGPTPPNAAELLTGDRFSDVVRRLSAQFDHVIIDAPPVMGLADTPLIASHVEGVVLVLQSHATRASAARVAIGRLQDAHARILGVLLTKFESRHAHYGYGYEYGYGYGKREQAA
jgi:capsular exopolysaccharide synthesis family protein